MAYVARPSESHSGVYEALGQRLEEKCARRPEFVEAGGGGFFRCPDHGRLEAMRRGEPVEVPGYLLPRSVRDGAAYQNARHSHSFVRSLTATVWPDGRIAYRPESAREWLEENMPGEL